MDLPVSGSNIMKNKNRPLRSLFAERTVFARNVLIKSSTESCEFSHTFLTNSKYAFLNRMNEGLFAKAQAHSFSANFAGPPVRSYLWQSGWPLEKKIPAH